MSRTRRISAAVALLAGAAVALSSCSSSGGKTQGDSTADGGGAKAPTMTVAFITHSGPGDTFWDLVRRGAEDAGANDGVKVDYVADPDGANQANLVKQAVDKKVDGIAVTLAKPDAMAGNIKAAVAAGIPVVALNSGSDRWKDMGIMSFFGQDERIAGKEGGTRLTKDGAKKVLCVIHEQGNIGLEERCAGIKDTFAATDKLYVTGTDMGDVQSKITAKLQEDKALDRVVLLGAPYALTAIKSVDEAGSKAKLVTFDLNKELAAQIKAGKIDWAIDQQPYLQGYMAVDSLWLNKTNGNVIGGGQPVLTGPAFVDSTNVAAVEKFAANGKR